MSFLSLFIIISSYTAAFQVGRRHNSRQSPPSSNTRLGTLNVNHQRANALFVSSFDEDEYLRQLRPIPTMPSPLFVTLAQSQMELLAFSVDRIKAMSLYLPQENTKTGQLEFLPAIIYPHSERVFIANDANSGEAPSLPRTLTLLPGFQHATSLLPGYPMVSSNSPGVGSVDEVMCDPVSKTSALSVPLFQGSQTVGVLMIWSKPSVREPNWRKEEKKQISRAAQSLSLALSMDTERKVLEKQSENLQTQLSDALHQVKNPIQALRTYGKLLQRKLADSDIHNELKGGSPQLLELAQHLMVQSDRVVDLMSPFDTIVNSLPAAPMQQRLALNPYTAPISSQHTALTPWSKSTNASPQRQQNSGTTVTRSRNGTVDFGIVDFSRDSGTNEFGSSNGAMEFSRGIIPNRDTSGGTIDFSRGSKPSFEERQPTPTANSESYTFTRDARDVGLEMGFVMDILDPIFSGGKGVAADRGIDLQIEASDELTGVWTNPKALQEAVANVLDNAIKYVVFGQSTYPRVVVQVDPILSADRHEPGIRLRISDNGPGVPVEERDAIFFRGYRGERTRSAVDGSGIGLDISQSMVARMGGELRLVKTSHEGSTFEFILYRNRPIK
jgi:signal transduction histidine kinase